MHSPHPWVLVCAGMNLMLAQYWTMKEYALVLDASEVTVLLVVATFLASCSLGFLLSPRHLDRAASTVLLPLFLAQLAFPWLLREAAAAMYRHEIPHVTAAMLAIGFLVMAVPFTILLPHLIRRREAESPGPSGEAVAFCYGLELAGAVLGIALILLVARTHLLPVLVLYFVSFSMILAWAAGSRRLLYLALPLSLAYGLAAPSLERMTTEDFYRAREGDPGITLLASARSLYNRIDVLQNGEGKKLLEMNGREYFNETDLEAFNRYLAWIPSALMPGSRVLIVGTGSLSSAYQASRFARSVESVEIDEQVVALTRNLFREFNRLDRVPNWTLHVDDAKHFLGSTDRRYDLIILDLVPPIYVQDALLFSREFYELVRSRLAPRGVLSIYTGTHLGEAQLKKRRHAPEKTIDAVFPEYLVLNSRAADMAFVYASPDLPFGKEDLLALLRAQGTAEVDRVFEPAEVRPLLDGQRITSHDDLGIVLDWAPSGYRGLVGLFGVWP